ncbi:2Fe-2S iron-sulfur cluster-binding protein [Veronia nyctiphanis]|uniref:2Fe-2S iron-sulfur cluster-binding protein n=1 Tax=Veronia nyctiphanis TaxID=1278244 RepID=UPI001F2FC4AE|nr:2Fe-2S iron-sulfur cluster-binding protein [Veronia nyctiphanis]
MVEHYIPTQQDTMDFGTPPVVDPDVGTVSLTIDGWQVDVPEGTSVMRAAAMLNIQIPKLCATDSLDAFGSCRLCVVEIEGMRGKPAACTTPVAEGWWSTPRMKQSRSYDVMLWNSISQTIH